MTSLATPGLDQEGWLDRGSDFEVSESQTRGRMRRRDEGGWGVKEDVLDGERDLPPKVDETSDGY